MQRPCKSGFLVINKPLGERSTHCVETVRHILGKKSKVGHGGTLDSTATGVLVVLVGAATRLSNIVMGLPKCYETVLEFGAETDTDDASGEVTRTAGWKHVCEDSIDTALAGFSGWRFQTPPSVSAVHVNGKRAHELTRIGGEVKIAAKPVYFEKVTRNTDITSGGTVSFEIRCQKGTYIRSFGRDLARALNSAGHIISLRRNFVGPFEIDSALNFAEIEKMDASGIYEALMPLETLEKSLPAYRGDISCEFRLAQGQNILLATLKRIESAKLPNCFAAQALLETENYFALCDYVTENGKIFLHPSANLNLTGEKIDIRSRGI